MKSWLQAIGARLNASSLQAKVMGFLLFALVACGVGYAAFHFSRGAKSSSNTNSYAGEPVPLNLNPAIGEGFRGDVHPLLHGKTQLELTASWVADGFQSNPKQKFQISRDGYHFFLNMTPVKEKQTYTEKDFSAFLPDTITGVGQIWSLNPKKVEHFLHQFHPAPSMHLDGEGRRVGPDGSFAILRAMTPSYLDIVFRVHAEFDVSADLPKTLQAKGWYGPAFFSGQMIVNRDKGTVEFFRLAVPTDRSLNVQLTLKPLNVVPPPGEKALAHAMARIDRMELRGGDNTVNVKASEKAEAITQTEAQRRLQSVYYKFLDIHWLPFDDVLTAAREQQKPILVVVLWGNLDDQSC